MTGIEKRLTSLEGTLSASLSCATCHGTGVDRIYASAQERAPCAECGRLPTRWHIVHGVSQRDLDAMFQPAGPRAVAPYVLETIGGSSHERH